MLCPRSAIRLLLAVAVASAFTAAGADEGESQPGAVTLMRVGPEYAVYLTKDAEPTVAAYMTRGTDGPVTPEWSIGISQEAFQAETRSVTLHELPAGAYTVHWWSGQVRSVGKTLLNGVGSARRITVGGPPTHVSLEPPAGIAAPTRLNVAWGGIGTPNDVSVFVDDLYVGHAFDSAELSVFGLPKGQRRVRVVAPGYRPVELTLTLSTSVETTRFVQMRRLGGGP